MFLLLVIVICVDMIFTLGIKTESILLYVTWRKPTCLKPQSQLPIELDVGSLWDKNGHTCTGHTGGPNIKVVEHSVNQ